MPLTPHTEKHFTSTEMVRDIVIGMADGLTVPFALAAGLSGAVDSTGLIITAGLAEVAAGAIAMGLGGYLAAQTDLEHYTAEHARELSEVQSSPDREKSEVAEIFRNYGLDESVINSVLEGLCSKPNQWVDFMMKFELGLEKQDSSRARNSAITIAFSYIVGGLIPLLPYFIIKTVEQALISSVFFTLLALFIFGFLKGKFTTNRPWVSAYQTMLVGALAAFAAFSIAKLIG